MRDEKLSEKQLKDLLEQLNTLAAKSADTNMHYDDRESYAWKYLSKSSITGKQLYESLSDEDMLEVIRDEAKRLDHAPSQKEMFWVWREYIKLRFQKWPYALKAANLPTKAGTGGKTMKQIELEYILKENALESFRQKAIELGRIPHPKEMPEVKEQLKKYMLTWADVVEAAKLNNDFMKKQAVYKIENLNDEQKNQLTLLRSRAEELNRSPFHNEVSPELKQSLVSFCGSWRNALHQIDLEPIRRRKPFSNVFLDEENERLARKDHKDILEDCYYKIIKLSDEDRNELEVIKKLYLKNKGNLNKRDVTSQIRQQLQESCGSWANALFQVDIEL